MRKLSATIFFAILGLSLAAQDAATPSYRSFTPKDGWELGIGLGLPFVSGDLDPKFPGFGGSLHLRKSLDHVFSIRGVGSFLTAGAEGGTGAGDNRESDLRYIAGSVHLVASLNNIRYNKPFRKLLVNGFIGAGISSYRNEYTGIDNGASFRSPLEGTAGQIEMGGGIAYRVSPRFNIGLEHTIYSTIGQAGDQLDGDLNRGFQFTSYRDILHYPHLTLAFNLIGKKMGAAAGAAGAAGAAAYAKSEPLYWLNPNAQVADAITQLEARPIYDPTDTDADGIIDAIDDEDNSPAGARVDSRGKTLDSDGDKVPDYQDKEPFSPPGYPVDAKGVANVPKPNYTTEEDVNRLVDAKLAKFKMELPAPKTITDWFLPMINFDLNSSRIKQSEYAQLYQVAQVLKTNPDLRIMVQGHTDRTGGEGYNNVLSFNRAKAAVDFLVKEYGVARNRLVVGYAGEATTIIPTNKVNMTNRRVEFKVAKDGEADMAVPPNVGRFKANTDAGY
jgi:OmpA-OmpF porin, OOP family